MCANFTEIIVVELNVTEWCTRVIWKVVAIVFYFENEARNLVSVYIFRYINIPSANQSKDHLDMLHFARAGDSRVIGPCYDNAWNLRYKMCDFRQELFS